MVANRSMLLFQVLLCWLVAITFADGGRSKSDDAVLGTKHHNNGEETQSDDDENRELQMSLALLMNDLSETTTDAIPEACRENTKGILSFSMLEEAVYCAASHVRECTTLLPTILPAALSTITTTALQTNIVACPAINPPYCNIVAACTPCQAVLEPLLTCVVLNSFNTTFLEDQNINNATDIIESCYTIGCDDSSIAVDGDVVLENEITEDVSDEENGDDNSEEDVSTQFVIFPSLGGTPISIPTPPVPSSPPTQEPVPDSTVSPTVSPVVPSPSPTYRPTTTYPPTTTHEPTYHPTTTAAPTYAPTTTFAPTYYPTILAPTYGPTELRPVSLYITITGNDNNRKYQRRRKRNLRQSLDSK